MSNELKIERKDSSEDIGFVAKMDPWVALSEMLGDDFKEYRRKWEAASNFELELDYPLQIDFELNNTCNFRCEFCTFSIEKVKKAIYFPEERYKAIVEDGVKKGLRAIDFSFVNEPLIRKDLPDLIKYAKDQGVLDLAFNTNAQLLTEEVAHKLIDSGLTRIQFSMDAFSSEIFDQVRKGGDYDKVMSNVLKFLEIKKEKGAKLPLTAVSFIRMSINEHQWDDFVKFWEDKVDYIILREYLVPIGSDNPHYEDKKKLFASQQHVAQEFRCDKPWQRIVLRSDGTVLPCCTFFAPSLPMGNAFESSVEEIWNSKKMHSLRTLHKNGHYYKNKICKECALGSTVDCVV